MISLESAAMVLLYAIGAMVIFGLFWLAIQAIAKRFPGEAGQMVAKVAEVILIVLALLVCIGLILSLLSGKPLFRP